MSRAQVRDWHAVTNVGDETENGHTGEDMPQADRGAGRTQ
jgi:hypothetical protein